MFLNRLKNRPPSGCLNFVIVIEWLRYPTPAEGVPLLMAQMDMDLNSRDRPNARTSVLPRPDFPIQSLPRHIETELNQAGVKPDQGSRGRCLMVMERAFYG